MRCSSLAAGHLASNKLVQAICLLAAALMILGLSCTIALGQTASSGLQPLKDRADELLLQNQYVPALDLYHQIISKEPDFANCYYNMAICHNMMCNFQEAFDSLVKFVELKPNDSEAYFNMGIMQVYLGDDEKARTLLKKARILSPSKDIKRRIKNALDHLQPCPISQESLAAIESFVNQQS